MSAETDLYAALTGAFPVQQIVGSGASARIYPDIAPQERQMPCVAYSRSDTEYIVTIHSAAPKGEVPVLDVYCMAMTRTAADALAYAVLTAACAAGFMLRSRSAIPPDAEQNVVATVLQLFRHYPL